MWKRGKCSNCSKKNQRVHPCGSVQLCKSCGIKLKEAKNQMAMWK